MSLIGKFKSLISQCVYSVYTLFHPFGGAIDVIVVQQEDGSFRCTPWYVKFGKFQGVLKGFEKNFVKIYVNGIDTDLHMYLDHSGEAYFIREVDDQHVRINVPTNEQVASLNLKDGQNIITFSFSTRVLGTQEVHARIYQWRQDTKIVISDIDGTITKSDALGQFMPLVGKDWTQSGVVKLFSVIEENGYQLLFLSARAIVQAYLSRSFLVNLKQDGKALPNGPLVISPDGVLPSLYRAVIKRAPHEFKIVCLQDIRKLFPRDYNPFYAGFGNRLTDKISYIELGIPTGKIFIINPKGEVAIGHHIDVKNSYTSLHTLVNNMFPSTSLVEQETFNQWNYWKLPVKIAD